MSWPNINFPMSLEAWMDATSPSGKNLEKFWMGEILWHTSTGRDCVCKYARAAYYNFARSVI
jgi:hypothetical protein